MARKKIAVKTRKTYGGSKIMKLSPARRAAVFTASENGKTVAELAREIETKDGVKISHTSLGAWLCQMRAKFRLERTSEAVKDIIGAAKELNGGEIDAAIEALVKQKLFDFIAEDKNPEVISELFRSLLASRKLSIDERKLAILEKKAKQLDAVEKIAKKKKSDAEKLSEIDKILLG